MSDTDFQECPADTARAGRESMCDGCPGQAYCQSQGGVDPDQEGIDLRMGAIKHKILVLSGKGGVGKSTVAMLLTRTLARQNHKVGIVDMDICGPSIPKLAAVENQSIISTHYGWKPLISPGTDIKVMSVGSMLASDSVSVVFRGPRKTGLIKRFLKDTFWGRLDYLVCDTPPGTSDEHLTVVKALKNVQPDGAIIVTTPQTVAISTIRREISFCRKMGVKILGLVGNMETYKCPCCGEHTALYPGQALDALSEEYNIPILARLPLEKEIVECCENGCDPTEQFKNSAVVVEMEKMVDKLKCILQS